MSVPRFRKQLRWLAAAVGLTALILAWDFSGPTYQGRGVRYWFRQAVPLTYPEWRDSEARKAFHTMGARALRHLPPHEDPQIPFLDRASGWLKDHLPAALGKVLPAPTPYRLRWQRWTRAREIRQELLVWPAIHQKLLETASAELVTEADMKPYSRTIPGSTVHYHMVPIPGGEFLLGSPESETGRSMHEGPQVRVRVSPFWMGKYEVTWNEYELFMPSGATLPRQPGDAARLAADDFSDAVSRPSHPYFEMSGGMGTDGYPAVRLTQYAAIQFCVWLSAKTGHFYRLPTEAEWEYACRAGTTTPYYFGNDPSRLHDFAWFEDNSDLRYQRVGRKLPNPWGLHDMHGNVAEWTMDQFDPAGYLSLVRQAPHNPWNQGIRLHPRSVRGGSWDDPAENLRSAARLDSNPSWNTDPTIPKSIWWNDNAPHVGFRIVRPLHAPSLDELGDFWPSGVERDWHSPPLPSRR